MKNIKEFEVNKKEVLRYLGYKGQEIDKELDCVIEECRKEVKELIIPRYVYKFYNIDRKNNEISMNSDSLLLKGEDIKKHLENSKECILIAVTIGSDVEKKIKLYERINLTKALIMDACATTIVEELCDCIEAEIRENLIKENKSLTFRFSPGYGDLDIGIQKNFIQIIEANKKIGVTVSSNNILFPRRSVTAIMGIVDGNKIVKKRRCIDCSNYNSCNFRKEGVNCGD
ncbi:vitamin B12 dependent-methionine synthase activation domain-containing protein [Clostridium chauvoei]|uniref:vitamin B12 dependent-methionine synthase activation domain-containing protein n=1 Tax=Clostridium chauvoei TaxID=46867 RepID=UPI000BB7754C|nr:vitamin B12 dependent-methionine synthase activation domain-containing protein [Clostridium chauvoei]ATD56689.1 methionine synthase [Clostridium chauvoei]MBX7378322.1 methionine synthase [Clostridium chauvoei]MBX7383462.1 methionine synthase [Clostridium chauvoei]MBX7395966.1 methionine synthase [Clostridium chauvoei]MBX7398479.1 methionine synthase [Clostridium chauvoei]